jgi:acetyl-CoA acetyltransferase
MKHHNEESIAIVGVGRTETSTKSSQATGALVVEACRKAIADAGLSVGDVDGISTYSASAEYGSNTDVEGLTRAGVEFVIDCIEFDRIGWFADVVAGPPALAALDAAVNALKAHACDVALVYRGVHKPKTRHYGRIEARRGSGDTQFTLPYGMITAVHISALYYSRYLDTYYRNRESTGLATFAVNNRHNALLNPYAVMQQPMTIEDYFASRWVVEPLHLFDCDVPVDGAVAIVLTRGDRANGLAQAPVHILAHQLAHAPSSGHFIDDDVNRSPATWAADGLLDRAGVAKRDIDFFQAYDGFSPLAVQWLETFGFCDRGEGLVYLSQPGQIGIGGELPMNTFGGSLSEGRFHGMGHIMEAVLQLRGGAGQRQVPGAQVGLVTVGGYASCAAMVLADGAN